MFHTHFQGEMSVNFDTLYGNILMSVNCNTLYDKLTVTRFLRLTVTYL